MKKTFTYLQFLVFPFSIAAMIYIGYGTFVTNESSLEYIGTGVLCMGIAFAFGSMGDISEVSKKEEKLFNNPKKYKWFVISYAIFAFVTLAASLFFVSMKWLGVNNLAHQYYTLGLNLLPIVIAVFFNIKQVQDKKQYFELQNETQPEEIDSIDHISAEE